MPACKADDTCEEIIEATLEDSLGGDIVVTGVGMMTESRDSGVRMLMMEPSYLRGNRRFLQESGNDTETEIDFTTTPGDTNLTRSEQAAEQVNLLAEDGLAELLGEMGLPADSNVTISNLLYTEGEANVSIILVLARGVGVGAFIFIGWGKKHYLVSRFLCPEKTD